MEFTKAEQRMLSPRHEKWDRLLLREGILMICASLALIPYHHHKMDKLRQMLERTLEPDVIQRIQPATKIETTLKDMLIKGRAREKECLLENFELKTSAGSILLFVLGINVVSLYFMRRRFMRLIRKLEKSYKISILL